MAWYLLFPSISFAVTSFLFWELASILQQRKIKKNAAKAIVLNPNFASKIEALFILF